MPKQYTQKNLERAKRARQRYFERVKSIIDVCNCCWPVINYRHRGGHDRGCPAQALIDKWHEEDKEARVNVRFS